MKKIITKSEKETYDFAKKFAANLAGGEVIGLVGDLGAGKTVFTKGLAAGLGVKDNVNSPTFVLMKVYKIKNSPKKIKNLIHVDAYRIKKSEEISGVGLEEYMNKRIIVVIEWPQNIQSLMPKYSKIIKFKSLSESSRLIIIN